MNLSQSHNLRVNSVKVAIYLNVIFIGRNLAGDRGREGEKTVGTMEKGKLSILIPNKLIRAAVTKMYSASFLYLSVLGSVVEPAPTPASASLFLEVINKIFNYIIPRFFIFR